MNPGIVGAIIGAIVRALPEDLVKQSVGKMLEHLKEAIVKSENKWDDSLLPLIDALEKQIGYVPPAPVTPTEGNK